MAWALPYSAPPQIDVYPERGIPNAKELRCKHIEHKGWQVEGHLMIQAGGTYGNDSLVHAQIVGGLQVHVSGQPERLQFRCLPTEISLANWSDPPLSPQVSYETWISLAVKRHRPDVPNRPPPPNARIAGKSWRSQSMLQAELSTHGKKRLTDADAQNRVYMLAPGRWAFEFLVLIFVGVTSTNRDHVATAEVTIDRLWLVVSR